MMRKTTATILLRLPDNIEVTEATRLLKTVDEYLKTLNIDNQLLNFKSLWQTDSI